MTKKKEKITSVYKRKKLKKIKKKKTDHHYL
jgi:hypothetical protein